MSVLESSAQQSNMDGLFSARLTVNRGEVDQFASSSRQLKTRNQRLYAAASRWLVRRQECGDLVARFGNVGNQIAVQQQDARPGDSGAALAAVSCGRPG